MFKLQMDEMLAEVQLNSSERLGQIDNALRKLKSAIEAVEEVQPLTVYAPLALIRTILTGAIRYQKL
jgi:hypothetical protein